MLKNDVKKLSYKRTEFTPFDYIGHDRNSFQGNSYKE